MPAWLHWTLTILLAYPVTLTAWMLVGAAVSAIISLRTPFLPETFRFFCGTQYIQRLQDKLVSTLSILALLIGIYFLYKGVHIGASSSLLVFSGLLTQLFPLQVVLQGKGWPRLFRKFTYNVGIISGMYFCYAILSLL
jgi:hypothetical protein